MRSITTGLLTGLLVSALAAPAGAAIYSTSFSGTVQQVSGTGSPALGSTVSGAFNYSSDAGRFLSFTINGVSAVPPYTSTVTISPAGISNPYEAIYTASTSAAQGAASNTAFTLDLLAFNNFASANALSILATPNLGSQLETFANSFDGNYSLFSYSTGPSTGTTRAFTASLNPTSLVTSVPEPATLALLAAPLLAFVRRRRI